MKHRTAYRAPLSASLSASALAAALLLGACASAPPAPPPALVAARNSVHSAEIDPGVLTNAPLELKKATDALSRANMLLSKGEALSEVNSAAYVADRQAQAALALASAKRNEDAIRGAEADRERARADGKAAEAQRAQSVAATAQQRAASAEQRASSAQQQAIAAQASAAVANATAADAQAQTAALQQQLSDLQAQHTDRGMLVTLGDVLFEFNKAEVKPTAQASLRKVADFLQQHPERRILIEGYTDNVGSATYNASLSQQRAESVAAALAAMGVARSRIDSVGYGKGFPIADNNSDTNRALNRRVEVYISDNDKPVRPRA